jgi:CubicO group peptidase (beta-lactamase class C family)
MSKSFVAATVLLLRDEGVLQLDDPMEKWIPELQGQPLATADAAKPTVRHCLSMNSGLPEDDPWADRLESMPDDEYSALIGSPKTYGRASGVAYEYSNLGYTLLGRLIQNATGCGSASATLEYISARIIQPLGMKDTAWTDDNLDKTRLATGYVHIDGEWSTHGAEVQKPGAFSALGGIYSTVADLAIWVAGFLDAWPARDEPDTHPLCRASRREMQQVQTAQPLQFTGTVGSIAATGYCFGLRSQEDLVTGRVIGHSGGYPGFGSRMVWHPESKVGIIGLANGRYGGPYGTVPQALAAVVAEVPRQLVVEPHPAIAVVREAVDAALIAGDFMALMPILSANVDQDEDLSRRAQAFAGLSDVHGGLTPEEGVSPYKPTKCSWYLSGDKGTRLGVTVMINPESPPKIQTLELSTVLEPSDELKRALSDALPTFYDGELAELVMPIQNTSWVSCDGKRTGSVLLEGARNLSARARIDLDEDTAVAFTLISKHESLAA